MLKAAGCSLRTSDLYGLNFDISRTSRSHLVSVDGREVAILVSTSKVGVEKLVSRIR